jgi:hypothetical protein
LRVHSRTSHAGSEAALRRGVDVRLLCVDPELPDVVLEAIPDVDPRFSDVDTFRGEVRETARVVERMARRGFEGSIEMRYFNTIPPLHFFFVDSAELTGTFKLESYAPSHDAQSPTRDETLRSRGRPCWVVPSIAPEWREYFVAVWTFYWNRGRAALNLDAETGLDLPK